MGNKQSDAGARDFFLGIGGALEKQAGALSSSIGAPGALAGALSNYINSPLGGITLPIVVLGGLYVASQVLRR